MEIRKKYITAILAIVILTMSVNGVYAFGKTKKNTQSVKAAKTVQKQQTDIPYTNDIHSVFSLKDCVDIAVKYNPGIKASVYEDEAYHSKIGQAWANYFPSITVGANISRSGNKYSHTSNYPYGYKSMYTSMGYVPSVSADMLIFDFGKTKANADSAKRIYEAKQAETLEYINTIIYDIKSAYFNILFAQAQVKVYEDTVSDYQLQLDQAWGFYRLGKKAKIDVVTAEYNLGKAKLNLVKAKNVLEVAQIQLSQIMGIPEYTNYELSDFLTLNDYEITVEDAVKTAFDVRPELISAKKNMDASKMDLRAAKRNFTPDLGAYGNYDYGVGNDYNIRSTQVGVGLYYNGLNILRLKKQVDEARAIYNKSKAEYEDTKNTVYYNVRKNYAELQTAKEELVIAKLALDQAKEQYRQVTGRYKAGVGDAIELKDGENTYLNARLDFYNTMLNYNVTAASLEKEIGIPLKFSNNQVLTLTKEDL